eukprot:TRINITY_DN107_c0_g1_i21.p1 TRINITY_DN107_c0_g1~~TRINITY_DN107_c0_g1_i21.p1  ORF type:complete len:337 (+),score=107.64 TRINITY_DN107_c0_g1_i21:52-1062(+)
MMTMSKMAVVLSLVGSAVGVSVNDPSYSYAVRTMVEDKLTKKVIVGSGPCDLQCVPSTTVVNGVTVCGVWDEKEVHTGSCWIDCNGNAPPAPMTASDKCDIVELDLGKVSAQEINPAPSAPTSSTRTTRILEGMVGFNDMYDSGFYNFPPTMLGRYAQVPTVRTKAGYEMHMGCSAGQGGAGGYCDHFVVIYQCKPCEHADGGNIQAILLSKGFKPFRCGTYMDLDVFVESHHHNLIVFHKQTLQGNKDIIKAPELMEFTFFAFSPATTYCGAYTAEDLCWNSSPGECSWNNGECERDLCPKPHKPHGPWTVQDKCRVCPHDPSEDRFIPANSMAR